MTVLSSGEGIVVAEAVTEAPDNATRPEPELGTPADSALGDSAFADDGLLSSSAITHTKQTQTNTTSLAIERLLAAAASLFQL